MDEIDAQKLRGGFYTPASVVDDCLARVTTLLAKTRNVRILEPSAGDGAFARGLGRLSRSHRLRKASLTCVELAEEEAALCRTAADAAGLKAEVLNTSFFKWMVDAREPVDAVVGNPPFIRFQFVPEEDRGLAEWLLRTRGHELNGVANYWIPFVLLSLDLLAPGGAFSIVLPSEFLSTVSAGQVRAELLRRFTSLRVDLYPRKTFPDILQDVLVLSGVKDSDDQPSRVVEFSEHAAGGVREWQHRVEASPQSWTRFLLSTVEWEAFAFAKTLSAFRPLKAVASVSVSIVTGANDYFTVDDATVKEHGLQPWIRPLVARTADCPGLVFTDADHAEVRQAGKKCWLLDFSTSRPDPILDHQSAKYIRLGRDLDLHRRYKTSIREPWYRVPHVQRGAVLMAKRSHQHHRMLLNQAEVFTTDTIYRGDMTPEFKGRERDLVATFHNSVTLLSAEIEGRTYGGGVLELVPSEITRLQVPMLNSGDLLAELDALSRRTGGQRDADDSLIHATDVAMAKLVPGFKDALERVDAARRRLRDRRFNG